MGVSRDALSHPALGVFSLPLCTCVSPPCQVLARMKKNMQGIIEANGWWGKKD